MTLPNKRKICITVAISSIILLLLCETVGFSKPLGIEGEIADSVDMTVTRALGGAAFLAMLINLGYRVLNPIKKPFFSSVLYSIPAFLIAINNFPFSTVIKGNAKLEDGFGAVALLFLECMCVGLFEESAFRGVIFLSILKKNPKSRMWAFVSIVLSSVVFGLAHLINLAQSSPAAVFMQMGYSALIGAMCAVILMKTANIWLCVLIHGLFNFAGAVIPRCGTGEIWDAFTVVLTVVVSLLVLAYMIILFVKDEMTAVEGIYKK